MIAAVLIMAALALLVAYFIVERMCLRADCNHKQRMAEWLAERVFWRGKRELMFASLETIQHKRVSVYEILRAADAATEVTK